MIDIARLRNIKPNRHEGIACTRISIILLAIPMLATNPCHGQVKRIEVRVIAPPSTPGESTVFVAGNTPAFGNWDPGKVPMKKVNDSVWSFLASEQVGDVV